jgi:hypothetical protein
MVAQDLAQIVAIITEILDEGYQQGVFMRTVPLIVHLMVVGAIVFFKMSVPMRSKYPLLSELAVPEDEQVSGFAADEIEKLILKAIRK